MARWPRSDRKDRLPPRIAGHPLCRRVDTPVHRHFHHLFRFRSDAAGQECPASLDPPAGRWTLLSTRISTTYLVSARTPSDTSGSKRIGDNRFFRIGEDRRQPFLRKHGKVFSTWPLCGWTTKVIQLRSRMTLVVRFNPQGRINSHPQRKRLEAASALLNKSPGFLIAPREHRSLKNSCIVEDFQGYDGYDSPGKETAGH